MKEYITPSEKGSEKVETWRQDVPILGNSYSTDVNAAGHPPAYSAASNPKQLDSVDLCCALKNFDWGIRDVAEFTKLLTQSHRLQFLYWVAIHRSRDQTIPNKERLSCPLSWCRMSFNEHEKLVDHVSACPHLDHGEYWCPYHQQAERFAQPVFGRLAGYAPQSSRRPSWKGAVKVIRRLGSKGLQKAIHPSRSRKSQFHGCQEQKSAPYERDQEDIQELMSDAQTPELDGQEAVASALIGTKIYEAASAYLPFEMDDTCNHIAELESETLSCPSMDWESTGNTTPDSALSPISPVSPGDQWNRQSFGSSVSPISPVDRAYTVPWTSDETCLTQDVTTTLERQTPSVSSWLPESGKKQHMVHLKNMQIDTSYTDATVFMWSNEVMRDEQPHSLIYPTVSVQFATHSDTLDIGATANNSRHRSLSSTFTEDTAVSNPSSHVVYLQDIFHLIFSDTMQKLSRPPVSQQAITLINLHPSAEFLFESGFEALRKLLHNDNKLSFWEIFGLSHLAYASVILSNPTDVDRELCQIFLEILQLSSQIISSEDKAAFAQLAYELWSPEQPFPNSVATSDGAVRRIDAERIQSLSDDLSFTTTARLSSAQPSINKSTGRHDPSIFNSTDGPLEVSEPRWSMTSCRTLGHCLQTLESFEYATSESQDFASTPDKSMNSPYLTTPRDAWQNQALRRYITEPLIQEIGLEGFMEITINADRMLEDTMQVGLRELELKLLNDGKHCSKSQVLYERFARLVMYLCDQASIFMGGELQSRESYYLQDIDHILSIYRKLQDDRSEQPQEAQDVNHGRAAQLFGNTSPVTEDTRHEGLYMKSKEVHLCPPPGPTVLGGSPVSDSSSLASPDTIDQYSHIPDLPELDSDSQIEHMEDPIDQKEGLSTSTRDPSVQIGEASEGSLTCVECGKVFRGKLVWLQSNFQRHMREKHSEAKKFVCRFAGCEKGFSRKHNMMVHAKAVHGRTRGL